MLYPMRPKREPWILWLKEITLLDLPRVGGKTASLGEMYNNLSTKNIPIPNAFAITVDAYWSILATNSVGPNFFALLEGLKNEELIKANARLVRELIMSAPFPRGLEHRIKEAYHQLSREFESDSTDVAVRSSATAEDLPHASFAGQQETYLNVKGEKQLIEACRKCFASLFTERAISYRNKLGYDHSKVGLSICVQKMVRSDLACAGVIFSLDTESGFSDVVLIDAAYGLGENVVQGAVNPDEYTVFKPTIRHGKYAILKSRLGTKEFKLVYDESGEKLTKNLPVSSKDRSLAVLKDEEIVTLARWAMDIEDYYSVKAGKKTPVDLEWAKDGLTGKFFIVQARPETVQSRRCLNKLVTYKLIETGTIVIKGQSIGNKISYGKARIIRDPSFRHLLRPGEVLVADKTDPDWEPVMKIASAVVTNRGGRTCHAAIVSREHGIPAVIGTTNATEILRDGQELTISCNQGETGYVYDGFLKFETIETDLKMVPETRTKIMLNLANPENALSQSFLPTAGVGLAREEFIISNHVKIHPLALIHFDELKDLNAKAIISEITATYGDRTDYFVDKLAEGIAQITAAFFPKEVIVRLSDFKTNEYAHLIGGAEFEPKEENPMLGFRGASRYYHPIYKKGFALECRALRKVREQMGLTNLKIMVPFCRTPEEGRKVLDELKSNGLIQGQNGLEIYVMCEIPSNVLLADKFAEIFDGFSIGSNDLTQLVLGVDRDSATVASLFNERSPAVLSLISQVIHAAKRRGRKIGICGQAPSDYPEFATFLVREGIDSISLNPDALLRTLPIVARAEEEARNASEVLYNNLTDSFV